MGLILNIYITYNIKYPQYIYTVSKKLVLAFKVSFHIFFLHKHVNIVWMPWIAGTEKYILMTHFKKKNNPNMYRF